MVLLFYYSFRDIINISRKLEISSFYVLLIDRSDNTECSPRCYVLFLSIEFYPLYLE